MKTLFKVPCLLIILILFGCTNDSTTPHEMVFYTFTEPDILPSSDRMGSDEYSLFFSEFNTAVGQAKVQPDKITRDALIKTLDGIVSKYNNRYLYGTVTLTGSTESTPPQVIKEWDLQVGDDIEQEVTITAHLTGDLILNSSLRNDLLSWLYVGKTYKTSIKDWPENKKAIIAEITTTLIKYYITGTGGTMGSVELTVSWETDYYYGKEPELFATIPVISLKE